MFKENIYEVWPRGMKYILLCCPPTSWKYNIVDLDLIPGCAKAEP